MSGLTRIKIGRNPAFTFMRSLGHDAGIAVPQIFINDLHIGGCDDLYALERAGKLTDLLKD